MTTLTLSIPLWQKSAASSKKDPIRPYAADSVHPGPAWFIDVAGSAGLRMKNVNGGADTKKYIIETTGSGVAILDYDNDGRPDIFPVRHHAEAGREDAPPTRPTGGKLQWLPAL